MLIPPYHTHKACYDTSTHSRRLLYLANTFLPPYTDEIVERKGLVYRNPRIFEEILYHFNKIEQEFLHKDDCSDYIVNGYTQIILGLILRNPNDYINDYVSGNGYITSILKYLKENYSADISLTQTAKRYSISPDLPNLRRPMAFLPSSSGIKISKRKNGSRFPLGSVDSEDQDIII